MRGTVEIVKYNEPALGIVAVLFRIKFVAHVFNQVGT